MASDPAIERKQTGPRKRVAHRLYWRIWFAVSACVALFALLAAAGWQIFFFGPLKAGTVGETLAARVAHTIPPADAPPAELQRVLQRWHRRAAIDLAVFDRQGKLLMQVGERLPRPSYFYEAHHGLVRYQRHEVEEGLEPPSPEEAALFQDIWRRAFAYYMPDKRWLVIGRNFSRLRPPIGPFALLVVLALAVGLGTFPVVRRLTRRLERLQKGVEQLGAGNLATRVPVEGRDEVAQLAASFNDAAERIEQLLASHRSLLANASHELRSPLTRVRMAVELLRADARPDLKQEIQRDIAELDALIDEILLASRLDAARSAGALHASFEELDLTALVAEECARAGVTLEGVPATARGDARLLRRLVRNLLDNARRHAGQAGGAAAIDVSVQRDARAIVLTIADRGPGVADDERERIFEPFYRARGAAESAGGVGLGLALVRKIAHEHGGSVSCLPRAGGGSVFRVELPPA